MVFLVQYHMLLNHVGIINKSEEEATRFYGDFLGFEITKRSVIPAELSDQLFAVPRDTDMMVFERNGIKIEVFIAADYVLSRPDMNHIGLYLDNFSEIVDKAPQAGVELVIGKTIEKTVYFIRDFAGNLIEIKQN